MATLQLASDSGQNQDTMSGDPYYEVVKRRILSARAAGWDENTINQFATQDMVQHQSGIAPVAQQQPPITDAFGVGDSSKVTPDQAKKYVFAKAAKDYGWDPQQLGALDSLLIRESGWNPAASNSSSGAWGLFQFMPMHWGEGGILPKGPNSTLADQTVAGLKYIAQRYGNPSNALNFWLSRQQINGQDVGNWY